MNHLRKIIAFALVLSIILSLGAFALADAEPAAEEIVSTEEEILPEADETSSAEGDPAEEPAAEIIDEEPAEDSPAPEETSDQEEDAPASEEAPTEEAEPAEAADEPAGEEPAGEEPAGEEPAGTDDPEQPETDAGSAESEDEETGNEEASEEPEETEPRPWVEPGNTDAEILGGGRFLTANGDLYYSDGGIWRENDRGTALISGEEGANLNFSEGWLYYTLDSGDVRRVPADGGTAETVYSAGGHIKQLYVMGPELRFLCGGSVWSYDLETEELTALACPADVMGFIPTEFGNLYLTGEVFDYILWAEENALVSGIEQCYTDSGWLVYVSGGQTMMAELAPLFEGSFLARDYSLHQDELYGSGLDDDQQLANEAAYLQSDEYQLMQDGLSPQLDGAKTYYYVSRNSNIASTAYTNTGLTDNQKNMVLRARQMAEVKWTPLKWRYSWGGDNSSYNENNSGSRVESESGSVTTGYFRGGETYMGVPYSQAVYTGYVGWSISIDGFVEAVNNSSSLFYSGYSTYSRTAPYYGSDCSGFVSWAWDLPTRCTCTTILSYSTKIANNIQNLRIGDSINNPNSHIVLVTNIGYDASGNVVAVEITEQTPCKMRVTCYGELFPGKQYERTGSLSYLQSYYFSRGYSIYRRSYSGGVSFTESDAVNLEETGYAPAPLISLTINSTGTAKVVELLHSNKNAVIYYTTDGSVPSEKSNRYTKPFEIKKETTIKAMAVCGEPYTGSYVLTYTVSVDKAEKPFIVLVSGAIHETTVSSGSKILIQNSDEDKIYYTTDGSVPTRNSTLMPSGGITITKAMTLRAVAVSESNLNSDVVEMRFSLGNFRTIKALESSGGYISPGGETSVLNGQDQTFEIKALEFFKIADVLVDGVSVGAVKSYTFKSVTKDHTIQAVFDVDMPFADVTNQWYSESVGFVYSHGLFSGTSATSFSPTAKMTRGMFITVLGRFIGNGQWKDLESWSGNLGVTNGSRISVRDTTTTSDISVIKTQTGAVGQHIEVLASVPAGVDGAAWYRVKVNGIEGYMRATSTAAGNKTLLYVYTGRFRDLTYGAYYTGYAQWAYIYGLMNGTSDTTFSPNQSISRQDICVMFYRYLKNYSDKTLSTRATKFTDDSSISSYAREAVYAMKNIGVVSGYEDGTFNPKGSATRAEVATMFQRLYSWMNG